MTSVPPAAPSGPRGPAWLVDDEYPSASLLAADPAWPAAASPLVPGSAPDPGLLALAEDALASATSNEEATAAVMRYLPYLYGDDAATLQGKLDAWVAKRGWQPLVDLIDRTHFPRDEDIRRVPFLSRRIDAMRDSLPVGQLVHNGRIYGVPGDQSFPIYMTPMVPGAETFSDDNRFFHEYWAGLVPIPPGREDEAMTYAIGTPSKGPDNHPATTVGTDNDVGPTGIPWMLRDGTDREFFPERNMVRSFLVESYDPERYPDVVVNQTIAGQHSAAPGSVMLGITHDENGNPMLASYGMGTTPWMTLFPPLWHVPVDDYWSQHNRDILAPILGPPPVRPRIR